MDIRAFTVRRRWGLALAALGLVVAGAACVPAPAPPPSSPFVVTGEAFSPPLETTTFVQSQPGQAPGTPCSLFPSLPTSVTVTATVAPVNGQVPDGVGVSVTGGGNEIFGA